MNSLRFRILKDLPGELVYRDGRRITLRICEGLYGGERLLAHRPNPPPGTFIYLVKAEPPERIAEKLARGFAVEVGGPAEKVLRALVTRGYAAELLAKEIA